MPKIKIKEFKGLYTNADENDLRLEVFKESVNFRHKQGYTTYEPRRLTTYDLPDIPTYLGGSEGAGWTWEKGIYTTLTNDPYAIDPVSAEYNVLVLIAKKVVGNTTHRLVWMKDLTNSSEWYEMSKNGNYPGIHILNHLDGDFTGSFFSTDKDGEVFFKDGNGILKIYFPHACFWLGRLKRNYNDNVSSDDIDGFYIDLLIEQVPSSVQIDGDNNLIDSRYGVQITSETVPPGSATIGTKTCHLESYHSSSWVFCFRDNTTDEVLGTINATGFSYTGGDTLVSFTVREITDLGMTPNGWNWADYGDGITFTIGYLDMPTTYFVGGSKTLDWDDDDDVWNIDEGLVKLIVTAVLDEREEIIVAYNNPEDMGSSKFVIKFSLVIPTNIGRRVTRIRIYAKQLSIDSDYALMKDIPVTLSYLSEVFINNVYIIKSDASTILSQNIGFLVNDNNLNAYKIITGFKDVATENGISLGLSIDDNINAYHSVVGGGVLQSNLLYTANILQLPDISYVKAVGGANGNLAVFTDKNMFVVKPSEEAGVLAFDIIKTLEYGVKNNQDVAVTGGNFIIHTRNGIHITNGYTTQILSEPINDIVLTNYSTGTIKYNPILQELYYRPTVSEDIYRYRFDDKVWELLNMTITTSGVGDYKTPEEIV